MTIKYFEDLMIEHLNNVLTQTKQVSPDDYDDLWLELFSKTKELYAKADESYLKSDEEVVHELQSLVDIYNDGSLTFPDLVKKALDYLTEIKLKQISPELMEISDNDTPERKTSKVLYNALSLLIDETWDQYGGDEKQEWFEMLQNNLGISAAELEKLGIKITVDGGLYDRFDFIEKDNNRNKDKEIIEISELGGFARNEETGEYEGLFLTEIGSEVLVRNRVSEIVANANLFGDYQYNPEDIVVMRRKKTVVCGEWEECSCKSVDDIVADAQDRSNLSDIHREHTSILERV